MYTITIITTIITMTSARFGQQNPPIQGTIGQLVGGSLGGQVPSTLLGGADPCEKLRLADTVVAAKPGDAAVLQAARELINAEANFNNFQQAGPKFCNDPTLPVTPELRGVLAVVSDEGVQQKFGANGGATAQQINDIAKASVTTPLAADGKSVGQLFIEQGFNNAVNKPDGVQAVAPAAVQGGAVGEVTVTVTETVCAAAPTGNALTGGNNIAPGNNVVGGNNAGAANNAVVGNNAAAGNQNQVLQQLRKLVSDMAKVLQ